MIYCVVIIHILDVVIGLNIDLYRLLLLRSILIYHRYVYMWKWWRYSNISLLMFVAVNIIAIEQIEMKKKNTKSSVEAATKSKTKLTINTIIIWLFREDYYCSKFSHKTTKYRKRGNDITYQWHSQYIDNQKKVKEKKTTKERRMLSYLWITI